MRLLSFFLLSSSLLFNTACVSPTSAVSPAPDKIPVIKDDFQKY